METEFKIGDKIVVIFAPGSKVGKFYNSGDIGTIKHINSEGIIVNFNDQNNKEVYFTGVCLLQSECIRKYVEEKPRFHNAQVGDEVYCRLNGKGIIKSTTYSERYLLECFFEKYNSHREYNLDGRHDYYCEEAMLFYRKGEEKYLTERPEPEVDWSKAVGAKVKVCDLIQDKAPEEMILAFYQPELKYSFWVYDVDRDDIVYGYKYCSLAEPCKPEWRK